MASEQKSRDPIIQIQHLTKIFDSQGTKVTALDDLTLDIFDGDIYGIIGMSGAGKSTLVRCINALEKPTSGTVVFCTPKLTITCITPGFLLLVFSL